MLFFIFFFFFFAPLLPTIILNTYDREVAGKGECVCVKGFGHVPGHEGCRDYSPPTLRLKGPADLTMKQCEKYVERGVEVMDSNSENDDRWDTGKRERESIVTNRHLCTFEIASTANLAHVALFANCSLCFVSTV